MTVAVVYLPATSGSTEQRSILWKLLNPGIQTVPAGLQKYKAAKIIDKVTEIIK